MWDAAAILTEPFSCHTGLRLRWLLVDFRKLAPPGSMTPEEANRLLF